MYPWTILQIRGETKKSCCLLVFVLFVSTVPFWVCGWFYIQPHLSTTVLFFSETQTLVIKGLTHDSAVSLPLYCLNRCAFVAPALTGTPPRWFISPVGLLAAAGDQTEEPWLSHQGNESEKTERRGALLPLCSLSLQPSNTVLPSVHVTHTNASHFSLCKNT